MGNPKIIRAEVGNSRTRNSFGGRSRDFSCHPPIPLNGGPGVKQFTTSHLHLRANDSASTACPQTRRARRHTGNAPFTFVYEAPLHTSMVEPMELRRPTPGSGGPQGRAPAAGRCRQNGPSGQGAAQQAQAQALQLDQHSTAALNLTVLQRQDPAVEEILLTAGHVTLYDFAVASSTWVRALVTSNPARVAALHLCMTRKHWCGVIQGAFSLVYFLSDLSSFLRRLTKLSCPSVWACLAIAEQERRGGFTLCGEEVSSAGVAWQESSPDSAFPLS